MILKAFFHLLNSIFKKIALFLELFKPMTNPSKTLTSKNMISVMKALSIQSNLVFKRTTCVNYKLVGFKVGGIFYGGAKFPESIFRFNKIVIGTDAFSLVEPVLG